MFAVLLLIGAVVLFRLLPTGWENFSPISALVLCSAAYLPRRWAAIVPLGALLVSDILLNLFRHHVPVFNPHTAAVLLAFLAVFALGWSLRPNPRWWTLFAATIGGALAFYLITNTAAWLLSPAYAKSLQGWLQCVTVGTPGFPPTWVFFRNSLAGDLFFTGLFLLVYVLPVRAGRGTQSAAATLQS